MLQYDPEQAPEADVWLAADEDERINAVLAWHKEARVELPNEDLHAAMHTIVENQLAEQLASVVAAIPRLMQQGLNRHEAIHAVATAVTNYIFEMQRSTNRPTDPAIAQARYDAAVDRLTAAGWRSIAE